MAAILPGVLGIVAIVLGMPDWLAAPLLGVGSLIAAGCVLLIHWRGEQRRRASAEISVPNSAPDQMPEAGVRQRRAIGYLLLEPGDGRLVPRGAQLQRWCAAFGLELQTVVHDTEARGEQRARPSLQWALSEIAAGSADTLVVTRLVDLSPSVATLAPLLRWFTDAGRALVALDYKLDTATPAGRLAADAVAGVGTWERERMSARTRRGLEAARLRGDGVSRAAVADVPALNERISRMREDGMTLQAIADALNAEGVPTLRGGAMWRPSSVQRAAGYRRPSTPAGGIELPRELTAGARSRA